MVFGKFMGDKGLDAQRAGLAESRAAIATLESQIRDSDALYDEFSRVWGDGVPHDLTERLGKARELADLMHQRIVMAKRELPNFDEAAALLKRDVPTIERGWKAFVAILIARKHIAGDGTAHPLPDTAECQRALMGLSEEFYAALRKHLDELAELRPTHERPWPPALDLEVMESSIVDIRGALDIYSARQAEDPGEMAESATVTLFDIISKLQNSITHVEEQRAQLAMDLAMHYAMANTGVR